MNVADQWNREVCDVLEECAEKGGRQGQYDQAKKSLSAEKHVSDALRA